MRRLLILCPMIALSGGVGLFAEPVAVPSPPSRFGKLTSHRWAYGATYQRSNLRPVPNPHPSPEPQPKRDHPFDVALTHDGHKAYIGLQGSEIRPGSEVAVYDVLKDRVIKRISLRIPGSGQTPGSSPYRLSLGPGGKYLLVTCRFSNFASVIDTDRDEVVSEIPLDYYCQGVAFESDGKRAFIANRYLDQVFVTDVRTSDGTLRGRMRELGGMADTTFFEKVYPRLVRRCTPCHAENKGGFEAGKNARRSFLSVLPFVRPGDPAGSPLLRAVIAIEDGGYADWIPKALGHADGTVVFTDPSNDPDYKAIADWIHSGSEGPGIPVSNPRSKPKICTLTPDGRFLLVGNTGTQDISIVSTDTLQEVGAIYIQNVVNDLKVTTFPANGHDYLLVTTLGVGFGVGRERDPFGGESWDRSNPATQFTVWRDTGTGKPLSRAQQHALGPFHAVDGTAGIKFRDIQNDVIFIDLTALELPARRGDNYFLLKANRYEAHRNWVRYTSDTAESTYGDMKGDIPPDLMRVVGAFPEKMALTGDRLFVSMQGSNLVQEWRINPGATDPCHYLVPLASYPTGIQPIGIAAGRPGTPAEGKVFVANFLGGSLSVIDTASGRAREVVLDPSVLKRPVPDTNAERGEIFAHTSIFSSDGDTSCFHCHYLDMNDGRPWGVSQLVGQEFLKPVDWAGELVIGGTMGVPQMRGLFQIQPFFFEGVISAFEPRSMMMEHNPADDFRGPLPGNRNYRWIEGHYVLEGVDDLQSRMATTSLTRLEATTGFNSSLEERRDEMVKTTSMEYFGKAYNLRDFQRFVGEWQVAEPHLLPNPYDAASASAQRGRKLFFDPRVGCVHCHVPPTFTRKDLEVNPEQALPPVVTFTARDGAFTLIGMNRLDMYNRYARDLEVWDRGRVEEKQGHITISQLRGIWDRPPVFLHHGLARTLREVVTTPGHLALRRFDHSPLLGGTPERPRRREIGFNETVWYKEKSRIAKFHFTSEARLGMDTHGGTSHLSIRDIDDLVHFMLTIE